jgi:competence protein ComEC
MLATLVEGMPGDAGGLVAGMVLGSKGAISQELYNVMQRTGMLHVVVASGFNVMLVAGLLTQMWVRVVRRQVAVALAIVGIWLYVLVVGGEAPVVRAGLMGTFAYLAVIFGRLKQVHVLFIYALLVMVWWRPDWVWDVGWQLSVVATAGLLWVEPLLRRPTDVRFKIYDLRNLFDWPVVGASLRTSVAAQVMVWPIISYNFGELSLSSLVVNGLTLWMVPIITVGGMAMAMLGLGSIEVASGGLWLLKPLVELFLMANRWFVAVPMMSWQVGVVGVVSYYVCLCFLIGTWQR